jgi:hypothetical protein
MRPEAEAPSLERGPIERTNRWIASYIKTTLDRLSHDRRRWPCRGLRPGAFELLDHPYIDLASYSRRAVHPFPGRQGPQPAYTLFLLYREHAPGNVFTWTSPDDGTVIAQRSSSTFRFSADGQVDIQHTAPSLTEGEIAAFVSQLGTEGFAQHVTKIPPPVRPGPPVWVFSTFGDPIGWYELIFHVFETVARTYAGRVPPLAEVSWSP